MELAEYRGHDYYEDDVCSEWPPDKYFDGVCGAGSEIGGRKCSRANEASCPYAKEVRDGQRM